MKGKYRGQSVDNQRIAPVQYGALEQRHSLFASVAYRGKVSVDNLISIYTI